MDMSPAVVGERARQQSRSALGLSRKFYMLSALLFLGLALVGFGRFYMHGRAYPGRPIPEPIKFLVIAHGVSMTLWLVFLVVQTTLVSMGSRKLHMRLGMLGAALAATIVVLGVWLAVMSARVTPPEARIWGMPPKEFMAVPMISVLAFGAMVGVGVWKRRRPAIHRSMMVSATLVTMSAAVSRIDALNKLYVGTWAERELGPFAVTMALAIVLLGVRCVLTRKLDTWLALGVGIVLAVSVLIMQIAPTPIWDRFASMLVP